MAAKKGEAGVDYTTLKLPEKILEGRFGKFEKRNETLQFIDLIDDFTLQVDTGC